MIKTKYAVAILAILALTLLLSGELASAHGAPTPAQCPADCQTLLAVKDTLVGSGDARLNWDAELPLIDWTGVSIDSAGRVTSLRLVGRDLRGSIPPKLSDLSNLRSLDLSGNRLTGGIPPKLGSLSNLRSLNLGYNLLSGSMPSELGNPSNLRALFINNNRLTGTLPPSLTTLEDIWLLAFDGNAGLCAPLDEAFRAWLADIYFVGPNCAGPAEAPVLHGPAEVSVAENSPRSTIIASYSATASNDVIVSYALRGADAKSFTIDKATGDLATLESLDYESSAPCPRAGCEVTVIASDSDAHTPDASLNVTITVTDDINDSVTTMSTQKANPVPGYVAGDPNMALADVKTTAAGQTAVPERPEDLPATTGAAPVNFVATSWANWGTVLRIEATSVSPDPNCGNGNQCVIIIVEADGSDDILKLEAYRSNYQENLFITAVMPVSGEGDMVETIVGSDNADEIAPLYKHPADGGVPRLKVDENDLITIDFGLVRGVVRIDNEAPNFFNFRPEHGETVDDGYVDYYFTVTDGRSGFPIPEDLPNDGDDEYIAVVALISDEQCQTPIRYETNGEPVWNDDYFLIKDLHAESEIACRDGATTEIREIVDDNDFEKIDHGLDVETTVFLPANGKRFVTFIACDAAGNCAAYDPDVSDHTVTLSEITIETRIDPDECIQRITAAAAFSASWTSESDCVSENSPDGSAYYARFYTFTLSEPADVTIMLTSEINTYLYLMSGAGKDGEALYESGDFIGFGTNSLIEATLAPGEYTIEATTYDSGVEGDFTLTVSGIVVLPPASPDREALKALYDATGGANWTDSINWLSDAPLSEWHGITTDDNGSVSRINLEGDNLTGTIPSEFVDLTFLEWVNISHNQLTGELPQSLTNLTLLEHFYFDNNAGLCAPVDAAFQAWAQSIADFRGDACGT